MERVASFLASQEGRVANGFDTSIIVYVNSKRFELSGADGADPEMSLLEFLRSDRVNLKGTKYGCGEGGCGACTVMVSRYDVEAGRICHSAVNVRCSPWTPSRSPRSDSPLPPSRALQACLMPLFAAHLCHVVTVEGIGSTRDGLHPVQERIARFHGSQCGFCTPGIVMSLYTLLRNNPRPSLHDVEEGFDGNLCRCTGYRPILDAAKTFAVDKESLKEGSEGCCGGGSKDKKKDKEGGCCGGSKEKEGACCGGGCSGAPTSRSALRALSSTYDKCALGPDALTSLYSTSRAEPIFPPALIVLQKKRRAAAAAAAAAAAPPPSLFLRGKQACWARP